MSEQSEVAPSIRMLPAVAERVETGPVQFGTDWPGVFIRGDDAGHYALLLSFALEDEGPKVSGLTKRQLQGLQELLGSCVQGPAGEMLRARLSQEGV